MFDVGVMVFFAILGFFLNRHGFAPAPIVMGLILGELIETSLKQSYLIYDGNLWAIVQQPIALVFLLLSVVGICGPLIAKALGAWRANQAALPTGNDE